jgi:hypothetical protein
VERVNVKLGHAGVFFALVILALWVWAFAV